jgi:hypothetical protein
MPAADDCALGLALKDSPANVQARGHPMKCQMGGLQAPQCLSRGEDLANTKFGIQPDGSPVENSWS